MTSKRKTPNASVMEPDERRRKKRATEQRCDEGIRAFRDICKNRLSYLPSSSLNASDSYNPTAEQLSSWKGTIHEILARDHKSIDSEARAPRTDLDRTRWLQENAHQPKYWILTQLVNREDGCDRTDLDVRLAEDETQLSLQLSEAASIPILFRCESSPRLSLEAFVQKVSQHPDTRIDVFDPTVSSFEETPRSTDTSEFAQVFSDHTGTKDAYNFLNIANRTGRQYLSPAVIQCCLETKCKHLKWLQKERRSLGKESSGSTSLECHPEFFIASKEGGISDWHVDKFGKATYARMLDGTKYWYMPRGHKDAIKRDHRTGEVLPGSEQVKLKLEVGYAL